MSAAPPGSSVVDPLQTRYTAVWEKLRLIAGLPQVQVTLDAGAANGEYVPYLLTRSRRVVALDLDPARIRQLRERFRGVAGVSVVRGSVDALPFRDRAFGLVWASEIVEHLPTLEASLCELERVSDAHVVATLPSPTGPYRYLDPTHRLRYSLASLRRGLLGRRAWSYQLEGLGLCLPQWLGLTAVRDRLVRASKTRPWLAWTVLIRGTRTN